MCFSTLKHRLPFMFTPYNFSMLRNATISPDTAIFLFGITMRIAVFIYKNTLVRPFTRKGIFIDMFNRLGNINPLIDVTIGECISFYRFKSVI